eukprot:7998225-Alexandrium_andersonii.AAC.1
MPRQQALALPCCLGREQRTAFHSASSGAGAWVPQVGAGRASLSQQRPMRRRPGPWPGAGSPQLARSPARRCWRKWHKWRPLVALHLLQLCHP